MPKVALLATLAAALLTSTAPAAMANVSVCGRTLFTPPGSNVFTGTWHRLGGQQLCAGLVIHGDESATYVFGDGNLTHPKGGNVSDNGKTYSFVDDEGSTYSADSDDVGRAFRLMSATCSDRSRPAVPIDVGRGGGAPAGWM